MKTFRPETPEQVQEIVQAAIANEEALDVTGNGSMAPLGRPVKAVHGLSLSGLSGVSMYEAAELVLTAAAGTPIREIKALLAQQGQEMAFEPIDFGPLLGQAALSGTIGGMVAVNAAGPRRIKAGAARDHVLGFRCITGRGDIVKSGGRVMKNVTGYDLSKLITGSYGTLGVMTEVTIKVLPCAETEQTLLVHGLNDTDGVRALMEASKSPHEGSSFAHLPDAASMDGLDGAVTAIRLEGPEVSVLQRLKDMKALLGGREFSTLSPGASAGFWAASRDAIPVSAGDSQVWRLSVAPSEGPGVVAAIKSSNVPVAAYFYDWAGGLIWLAVETAADAHNKQIRAAVDACGGHGTLVRAAGEVRSAVPVFHPQPAALAGLTARVKDSFDPGHILNPDRMRGDL